MRRLSINIKRTSQVSLLLFLILVLVGCKQESQAQLMVENFNIVDPYEYDKIKVVVEEQKTPEQVARDILQEEM